MLSEIRDTKASLWISASAGTGKTKNLIDRILALLLNGTEPSHIVCLTYTKAAANEMLERLSAYLRKTYEMPDDDLTFELKSIGFSSNYLTKIRELYVRSQQKKWVNIQTIHSFALDILRKFPMETGIYPGIKLCDDEKKKALLEDSFNFVLRQKKFHNELKIISRYTNSLIDLIKDNVFIKFIKFFGKNSHSEDIENFFIDYFEINPNLFDLDYEDVLQKIRKEALGENYREQFSYLIRELNKGPVTDQKKAECLQKTLISFSEDFIYAVFTKDLEESKTLCTKKTETPKLVEELLSVRKKAADYLENKNKFVSATVNIAFFTVADALISRFRELQRERHLINYDDIILQASDLLENNASWVFYKIDQNIKHLLIDEAQDTSLEQWKVISQLTAEFFANINSNKTIFIVGDEKQSIYSFQGANVELFEETRRMLRKIPEYCGQNFHEIALNKSYRSEGQILSFVDRVFSEDFPNVKHETTKNPNSGVVEIVDLFEENEESEKLEEYIANFIEKALQNHVAVKDNSRTAEPGDFLILFRHRDIDGMNRICEKLKKRHIPVSGVDRILLKNEAVVEDLIALAEFVLFPIYDLNLACVLKSPIIGMTEKDLMKVCLERKNEKLWNYLQKNIEIKNKYPIDLLERYLNLRLSCFDFFSFVLTDGLREKFINRLGSKCLSIIDEFLQICADYEKEYSPNLSNFLTWFRKSDQTIKKEFYAYENEVKIMTAHASKGLQAPFVILADAHFEPKISNGILSNQDEKLSWHFGVNSEQKPLELFWNFDSKSAPKSIKNIIEKNNDYKRRESRRLLYVAMTRAESYLCILGKKRSKEISKNCWYSDLRNNTENFVRDGISLRWGEYPTLPASEIKKISESLEPLPSWYFEKLQITNDEPAIEIKNRQTEFGDCVHLLLKNISIYGDEIKKISNDLMHPFDLSDNEKSIALKTAISVFEKFPHLFNEKSKSEVTVFFENKEYHMDKIAELDGQIWIVDFKTGVPQNPVPTNYVDQLKLYQKIYKQVCDIDAKIAILWTKSLMMIEI